MSAATVRGGARGGSPFSSRAVLAMLVLGAVAFIAALYFIGADETGDVGKDGGAHAAGNGLNGYAALAQMLGERGYEVRLLRDEAGHDDETLLVLTPAGNADAEEINRVISRHRQVGPTLLILPKWLAMPVPSRLRMQTGAKDGWVVLLGSSSPEWAQDVGHEGMLGVGLHRASARAGGWKGLGRSGSLPDPGAVQSIRSRAIVPLVLGGDGRVLAGYWNDGGYYPWLANSAGVYPGEEDEADNSLWPVVIVAEPDLVNNYGLADRQRAMLALSLVDATLEGYDLPVTFDLTLNGLGRSANLLTLAFQPPFLAATLCFLVAALVVAWRAFRRFGPPLAALPVFAFGKRQLATNGAALIQRSRRLHLLGTPYAAILRAKVAHALGLRTGGDPALTESEIDQLLARRGIEPADFSHHAAALRHARTPHELLRHAHALKTIERKLAR